MGRPQVLSLDIQRLFPQSDKDGGGPAALSFRKAGAHTIRFASLVVLYLLLAENFDKAELAAGAAATLIAVIALAALSEHNDVHFLFDPKWLKLLAAMARAIVRDSFLVLRSLPRLAMRPREKFGHFQWRNFEESIPQQRLPAWRALKIVEISLPPNTYVVDIDRARALILIHQLAQRHATARQPKVP
jgi:multisubunit Na+/H+ antiporter MnhE subunit